MIVEKAENGKVHILEAAAREFFSQELMDQVAAGVLDGMSVSLDILSITTSNGVWRYRIDSRMCSQTVIGDLVDFKVLP